MSTFEDLIADLTKDAQRAEPVDPLQFCANWFHDRLAEQRARALHILSQNHSISTNSLASIDPRQTARSSFPPSSYSLKSNKYPSPFGTLDVPGNALLPHQANVPNTFSSHHLRPAQIDGPSPHLNPGDYLHPPASTLGRRTSVSAETIQVNSTSEPPPVFPKSPEQLRRIRSAISNNFIFKDIAEEQMKTILNAMEEVKVKADEVLIRQGEQGDYFYLVEDGKLNCYIRPDPPVPPLLGSHKNSSQTPKITPPGYHPDFGNQVAECKPGDAFGELALMYGHPRAATVLSVEDCTLWRLDRITFRTIILKAAHRRRTAYEHFLSSVPLLEALLPEERSKIADVLISQTFADGEHVVREGDMGDCFYLVEEGEGTVTKRVQGDDGEWRDQLVNTLKRGDYFGGQSDSI